METKTEAPIEGHTTSSYEPPKVRDYGTIVELTEAATLPNGDVPGGVGNAFS